MREERGLIKELEKGGKMITGSDNLRKVVEEYYTRLFEKKELDKNAQGILLRGLGERLPEEETKLMDRSINKNEMYEALKKMKNNKVPGIERVLCHFLGPYRRPFARSI